MDSHPAWALSSLHCQLAFPDRLTFPADRKALRTARLPFCFPSPLSVSLRPCILDDKFLNTISHPVGGQTATARHAMPASDDMYKRLHAACQNSIQYPDAHTLLKRNTSRAVLDRYQAHLKNNDAALFRRANTRILIWEARPGSLSE